MDLPLQSTGDDPKKSCFTWKNFDDQFSTEACKKFLNTTRSHNLTLDEYGGRNPEKDFSSLTNIIFSNGDFDPWSVGGILKQISPNIDVINIERAAHGSDLNNPSDNDFFELKQARKKEI
jgi:hypothetical protein